MQQAVLIVLALAAVALFTWWWTHRPQPAAPRGKPRRTEALDTLMAWTPQPTRILTAAERQAYGVVRKALPDHLVFAQVPLARFLKVPTRHSYAEWLRRVGQLCADLVVCDGDSQVVAIVEVRQPTELESERTRKRHARMDRVLDAAGIPLHVWFENKIPSSTAARDELLHGEAALGLLPQASSATGTSRPPADVVAAHERAADDLAARDAAYDAIDFEEPPSSTWFDDLDSAPMPLGSSGAKAPPPRR
ncbi:DUF2726 domain-containing protein [Caldimonas brevitalea]|uniref:DUF2726 domain-containing protein n=1 Tax=Caldimonas brevitalea TaxID=413882 RepID=A0A0G3BE80_9BURK|nr:DUF2726 domain-containing protein [Caldimonas brevitalea]AKJ27734.1 hypothetical protein AAW51_1043 [Caldimonas brevitalea]